MLEHTPAGSEAIDTARLTTLEDWTLYAKVLLAEAHQIEGQLANRDRRDALGQRLDGVAYFTWRGKARYAWQCRIDAYRAAKERIKALRLDAQVARRPGAHAFDGAVTHRKLLNLLYWRVVKAWLREGLVDPSPDEQAIIDACSTFLTGEARADAAEDTHG